MLFYRWWRSLTLAERLSIIPLLLFLGVALIFMLLIGLWVRAFEKWEDTKWGRDCGGPP